ncbi:succinyl-CoA synthetase alpha subunit [Brevibacterium epidermidis]|jgi:succinyl-CoA synthetase alpha subunit|uniref:Succinyl-CoA synthetase alpha subunit n=1 Tax=Brevibacterium epidermidis TaxID=1698 RepID=A0ABV4EGK1_BREEP
MPRSLTVRRGVYVDSVALMQVSTEVKTTPGVDDALIGMASELNLGLIRGAGFDIAEEVTPNDLIIAIRAQSEAALSEGSNAVDVAFDRLTAAARESTGPGGSVQPALTVESALAGSDAGLTLVSVPGESAGVETLAALDSGSSVLLFSDNVDVSTEVELKSRAAENGLIVMGPDCGTAIISGVGLGFANQVRRGSFGIIAASGTGAQQVSVLLDAAGAGVSHLIGTGGRDLSRDVGGLSARQALQALAVDAETEHIIVVSKPADAEVVAEIEDRAAELGVRVSWAILGPDSPSLSAGVESALSAAGFTVPEWPSWGISESVEVQTGSLIGLFCGGTMADEAMLIARSALGPISSNIPLAGAELVSGMTISADTHTVLDFGADEMTRGRAHPMIDPSLRLQAIRNLGPRAGVLLLDLVLGHGAHADPADELAAAITDAKSTAAEEGRVLPVVVSLIGTSADPQDFSAAVRALVAADAEVFLSNAEASCRALAHLGCEAQMSTVIESSVPPERIPAALSSHSTGAQSLSGLLETAPSVVSVGLSLFAEELRAQAVPVTEVQWKPALGDPAALYQVMADPRRREANAQALERMLSAGAEVVGLRPARECLGLREDEFLHSGPPLEWDRASGPMRGALAGAVVFEGLAETLEAAEAGLADGRFTFAPCHSRDAVGPMAGVVSPSMWMFELVDPVHGNRAYCSLNEGLGKVLRYGANNEEVLTRLNWMRDVLGPVLAAAVAATGPLDTKNYVTQMLQSGDEGHNRNRTATLLFLRDIMPKLFTLDFPADDLAEVARFLGANDYFALNLVMPTCKLAMAAAKGVPGSTLVVTMARNGTDFGIQLAGTGEQWYSGPAQIADGLYLGSYGVEDANPDIGDSAITETAGIGGLAMAAAPAVVRLVGGDVSFAVDTTRRMYEITLGEHPQHQIPVLEFRGVPSGIDLAKVLRTHVLPQINTGMAGKVAGVGQVGAGLVTPPADCFTSAVEGLSAQRR